MNQPGVDLGVLGVLPIRAAELDSPEAIAQWLGSAGASERSRQLSSMSRDKLSHFVALLDSDTGPELLGSVDPDLAARVAQSAGVAQAAGWLEALDPDQGAEVLRKVSRSTRESVLAQIGSEQAEALSKILRCPPKSVSAHILPDVFVVTDTVTAAEAETTVRAQSERVRARADAYIYVTDAAQRLIGLLEFQDLVLAEPNQTISELMAGDPFSVGPLVEAEQAAEALTDRELAALPVVDDDGKLLGVLTADIAADILRREATADAERQGGSAPLEVPYLRASPGRLWRKRIVWLLVLFAAEAYTSTVLRAFEQEMETVIALAFFIPLLIGTGGNTGTQITTTLVRALATEQVRLRDLPRIVGKEMSTGFLVAATMAAAALIRAWMLGVGVEVTITVCLTVTAIVLWSSLVASILPPTLKRLRLDPAVVSAPMISTIVDGTGLMIYFAIAHLTIPQLAGL